MATYFEGVHIIGASHGETGLGWTSKTRGDGGPSPIQIHCFLDLRDMPEDPGDGSVRRMHCGPGIYAVYEGCKKKVEKKEVDMSEILVSWTKIFKSTAREKGVLTRGYEVA